MKLRTKTIAIFLVTTILLVGVLHTLSYTILLGSYQTLEQREVNQTVEQIHGAVENGYSALNTKLSDWSAWDDAYKFVQDNNSAFIASNLEPASLGSFGVNFLLFYSSTGSLVYGLGVNLTDSTKMPVPANLLNLISTDPKIREFNSTTSSVTGLVVIPEGPLILASQPILTSQDRGPSAGTLVFARYFDNQYLQSLSTTLRLPLDLSLYSNWEESKTSGSYFLIAPSHYIHVMNADSVAGYYVANDINGRPALVLGTVLPRDTYKQGLATLGFVDVSVGAASVGFSIAMLSMMEWVILSRLHKLDADVKGIGRQTGSKKLSVSGDDELSSLSKSINNMLEEIENKSTQLQRSERFAAIGELATMVAHDLRNPLQGIANAAFFLKGDTKASPKEKEMLDLIEEDVRYSDKIVRDLLDYSREIRLDMEVTNPRLVMEKALSKIAPHPNINIVDETDNKPTLKLDVDKVTRVFVNLINNSVDAMPTGGSLKLQTRRLNNEVQFIFADTGVGMKKEVLANIFTPLFTTKAKGMGFGLSISKRVVEAHGGHITVDSTEGKGTTFIVSIPVDVDAGGVAS